MRSFIICIGVVVAITVVTVYILDSSSRREERWLYEMSQRIHPGESLVSVQRRLGPGFDLAKDEVPVRMAELSSGPVPVVSGERILVWNGKYNNARLYVSLVEGLVQDVWYYEDSF